MNGPVTISVTRTGCPDPLDFVRSGCDVVAGQSWTSIVPPGLCIGLATDCRLHLEADGRPLQSFSAPMGFLVATAQPIPMMHQAQSDGALFCAHLHLPLDSARALFETMEPERAVIASLSGRSAPECCLWRTTPALLSLMRSVCHCPYAGATREFYLQGKALEFLALSLDAARRGDARRTQALTAADHEGLLAARDILLAEYADPPSLEALGRRVGMSVTRLTAGFRRLFGSSIVAFIQEHRLRLAYDALASGRVTVAQAAYDAGYLPSSFSTLFRRRYGVPPSALRARHL